MFLNTHQLTILRSLLSASRSSLAFAAGRNVTVLRAENEKTLTATLLLAGFLPETGKNWKAEVYPTGFRQHADAGLLVTELRPCADTRRPVEQKIEFISLELNL